jgi:hypothetical protein
MTFSDWAIGELTARYECTEEQARDWPTSTITARRRFTSSP